MSDKGTGGAGSAVGSHYRVPVAFAPKTSKWEIGLWLALPLSLAIGFGLGYATAKPQTAAAVFDARMHERAFAGGRTLEALQICSDAARAAADVAKLRTVGVP